MRADISAYEKRIAKMEREKLVMQEKLESGPKQTSKFGATFDELFELAQSFLANPCKIWGYGHLALRLTVLRLAFMERLNYSRKTGLRTPELSIPFKILGGNNMQNCVMAEAVGFEPTDRSSRSTVFKTAAFDRSAKPPTDLGLCQVAAGGKPVLVTRQVHSKAYVVKKLVRQISLEENPNFWAADS